MTRGSLLDHSSNLLESSVYETGEKTEKNDQVGKLGALSLTAIVYFLVCGGAYGTEDIGGAIPPAFALGGILLIPWVWSIPIALMTAEMATALPEHCGFIEWISRAWGKWGDFASFIDGIVVAMVVVIDQAVYPVLFTSYLLQFEFMPDLEPWAQYGVSVGFVFMCGALNLTGVESLGRASQVFSTIVMMPFIVFVICAIASKKMHPDVWIVTEGDWDVGTYLSVLVWATCGWEYSSFLAQDVQKPGDYPKVMMGAVILMVLTYLLPIACGLAVYPADLRKDITEGAYPQIADYMGFGDWLGLTMIVGSITSQIGTYCAYLHTASTALFTMAKAGTAPRCFACMPNCKAPVAGILFNSVATAILVQFDFNILVSMETLFFFFHQVLLCSAFLRLRFNEPELVRGFKVPGGPVGAVVICVLPTAVVAYNLYLAPWLLQVIATGVIVVVAVLFLLLRAVSPKLAESAAGAVQNRFSRFTEASGGTQRRASRVSAFLTGSRHRASRVSLVLPVPAEVLEPREQRSDSSVSRDGKL